ncbi:hypothetical protein AAE485_13945 [Acidithiobacillus ferriphilus]|jgi:hypothetical protein|uniref:hypothetical protein n=1 Tax=Acidithiobacillus ferriphilus TaxID=1689834 RepID=UPI001C065E8E|nr:hypothetical protein [Acidithiobacillus ferriphilus]MBU2846244.1 hypothetical protein [Acidithiobacillus ferriphilus]MEB8475356.1 hypothetical protein [Acidithiobacillus ferriphilus]WCE92891.1 hypothetical protein PJU76_07925 [Acidithiobacillus ferriphilus]
MAAQYTTVLRLLPEDYAAVKAKAETLRHTAEMLIRLGGLLLRHSKDSEKAGRTVATRKEFMELSRRVPGHCQPD